MNLVHGLMGNLAFMLTISGNGYDYPFIIYLDGAPLGYIQASDLHVYGNICKDPKGVFINEEPGIRFGGKVALGGYVANGIAIFGSAWGNFLEQASLVAVGPGVALLFDGPNLGLDFSLGIGRAFNALDGDGYTEFAETVLALNLGLAKYWWLSPKNSLGVLLNAGLHGFTLSKGGIGTFGFSAGLSLSYLFG